MSNKLKLLKIETDKKKQASGVEKYIDGEESDDSDDPFQVEENAGSMMSKEIEDPTKLIDF